MQYRDVQLRGIPVITKSGQKIGKLVAFVVDAEHHEVAQYVVTRSSLLAKFMPDELLVSRGQVISLDSEMMVVEDGLIAERAKEREAKRPAEVTVTGASAMKG